MKIRLNSSRKILPRKSISRKDSTVTDLLRMIHRRPDSVIVLKNKTPLPVDDTLLDDQELSILQVASGG